MDADSYLLELLRYIHRNPLESGIVENINKYIWSSHKAYLSKAKKREWLHKKYILSLFSTDVGESIRMYKQFISQETPEEINRMLTRKKLPAIIGSKSFIDKVKELFFTEKIHEEVPESRYLVPDIDKIIEEVCKFYNIDTDVLFHQGGDFLMNQGMWRFIL